MRNIASWQDVIDRFLKRLSSWKSNMLSIRGRLTLNKAVLGSLPIYYLSLFRAPVKVINLLESIRRRFFWGIKEGVKGMSMVSWKKVCSSRDSCGLGVGSLKEKNLSLLAKWWWRFYVDNNSLWCRVIKEIHGNNGNLTPNGGTGLCKGIWKGIANCGAVIDELGVPFTNSFIKKVGCGSQTHFWNDCWLLTDSHLKDIFPRLYSLETVKDALASDRWWFINGSWEGNWGWRSNLRGRTLDELSSLSSLLSNLVLYVNKLDGWSWCCASNDKFTVKDLSINLSILVENNLFRHVQDEIRFVWNNWIPKKINVCIWKAVRNGLPSLVMLSSRGIQTESVLCPLCKEHNDETDHCLLHCEMVKQVWRKVWDWWDINYRGSWSIKDIILGSHSPWENQSIVKAFQGTCYVVMWLAWNWRNKVLHASPSNKDVIRMEDLFPKVQRMALFWISNRNSKISPSWSTWISHPMSLLDVG